ncbi:hypothetical protein Tco_0343976 [Tanacetum coccineum]
MVLLCSIQQGLDFTRIGECLDEGSTVAERWGLFHIEPCLFGEVVADTVFELLSDGVCETEEQGILPKKRDPADDYFALTEAFYRAVLQSDRTHSPRRRIRLVL